MTKFILAFVVILACSPGNTQASHGDVVSGDIAAVVNASNPVNELTLSELRNMLRGDRRFWKGNVRVKLILREPGTRERDAVLAGLLKLDNKAFAALWRAKMFRGEASDEPLSVHDAAQVEQYLLENPGGIAFIAAKIPVQFKVLRLEGKLPGEHGYAVK